MGWLTTQGQTRHELIERRIASWENDGHKGITLKHTAVGNVLWTVRQVTKPTGEVDTFIGCDLMRSERGYGWGYKDMDEGMGPCYYTCPLSFLKLAPVLNEGWREKVRQYHGERARKRALVKRLKVGNTVTFIQGTNIPGVTISGLKRLRGWYRGTLYRVPLKYLA